MVYFLHRYLIIICPQPWRIEENNIVGTSKLPKYHTFISHNIIYSEYTFHTIFITIIIVCTLYYLVIFSNICILRLFVLHRLNENFALKNYGQFYKTKFNVYTICVLIGIMCMGGGS